MINKRIEQFRKYMIEEKIDAYYIPTADPHLSEYIAPFYKVREFMSGFTGSAGFLVITHEKAILWTDGRYFIQAENQLKDTCIELYRLGDEGVPNLYEYLEKTLPKGSVLGLDGSVVSHSDYEKLTKRLNKKNIRFNIDAQIIHRIWLDRPPIIPQKAYLLEESMVGETRVSKINRIRKEIIQSESDVHIVSSLEDVMWVLNMRGNDIKHVPVSYAYLVIKKTEAIVFLYENVLTKKEMMQLRDDGIFIKDYHEIYDIASYIDCEQCKNVFLDKQKINTRLLQLLEENRQIIHTINPSEKMKAIKNEKEIAQTKVAHIKDGIACARFLHFIKEETKKRTVTEIEAQEKLLALRKEQEDFIDLSFETICAYGENGAMMHYQAEREKPVNIKEGNFLLVDSGAHYAQGSTDITRTIAIGKVSSKMKELYTAVLKGHMNLAHCRFLHGVRGANLDVLARGPLWELGLDYKCGTGHGIGHLLSVHEGPNNFRWKMLDDTCNSAVLEEGMITTDEPGVYLEGEFGIRIENELLCKKMPIHNEYGQFMEFEIITLAPIDLEAIDVTKLSKVDRERINEYHKTVYQQLSPHMKEDEKQWLGNYTRAI